MYPACIIRPHIYNRDFVFSLWLRTLGMVAGFLSAWLRMLLWNPHCWWQFDTGTEARVV